MSTVSDYTAYSNATQRLKDSFDTERSQSQIRHEEEVLKLKADQERELETLKREYNEALVEEKDSARQEVRRLKEDLYGSNGKRMSEDLKKLHEERQELDRYRREIQSEASRRVESAEEASSSRADRIHEAADAKTEDALAAQRRSHVTEMKDLYDELAIYRNEGRDVETEKAKARQESIDSYESDHLRERDRIVSSYEKTVARMGERADEAESLYERVLADRMIEANARTRELASKQKKEFSEQLRDQKSDKARMENYYQNALKDAALRNSSSERNLVRVNQEQTEQAMARKDQTYGDYLERKNHHFAVEMGSRDELIRELQTTDDPRRASPLVVKRIQDTEQKRYLEELDATRDQNEKQLSAMKSRDQDERSEMRTGFERQVRNLSRDLRKDSDVKERAFVETFQDAQYGHERDMLDLKETQRNRIEKMHVGHAEELTREQQRNRDSLEEQRDTLKYERDRVVDHLSHGQRMKDREWAMRMHDLRRDFEEKIVQAKDEHEKTLNQLKYDHDKKLREQERTTRRQADEKDRGYEHRIKEMEMAFRERERFLTEHYEQELAKMKRTNAHLIAKKS
jgi:hypothetical protein